MHCIVVRSACASATRTRERRISAMGEWLHLLLTTETSLALSRTGHTSQEAVSFSETLFRTEEGSVAELPVFLVRSVAIPPLRRSERCRVLSHLLDGIQKFLRGACPQTSLGGRAPHAMKCMARPLFKSLLRACSTGCHESSDPEYS